MLVLLTRAAAIESPQTARRRIGVWVCGLLVDSGWRAYCFVDEKTKSGGACDFWIGNVVCVGDGHERS
jgi:hypothetical protein